MTKKNALHAHTPQHARELMAQQTDRYTPWSRTARRRFLNRLVESRTDTPSQRFLFRLHEESAGQAEFHLPIKRAALHVHAERSLPVAHLERKAAVGTTTTSSTLGPHADVGMVNPVASLTLRPTVPYVLTARAHELGMLTTHYTSVALALRILRDLCCLRW